MEGVDEPAVADGRPARMILSGPSSPRSESDMFNRSRFNQALSLLAAPWVSLALTAPLQAQVIRIDGSSE